MSVILQTLVHHVLDILYSCFGFSNGLMMTWRRHVVNNGGEARTLIGDDFGLNTISAKTKTKLDYDILGCRAGQVVDLDERREAVKS